MVKHDFISKSDQGKVTFLNNLALKLPGYATVLGLTPAEVASVFHVPLTWLADPAHLETRRREPLGPGPSILVHYFQPFLGEVIWGVTARITLDLLSLLGMRIA